MKDDAFVRGIATILWGLAWADHVEEHRCQNLSGCKIEDVMPEIPDLAWAYAWKLCGVFEHANPQWGSNWPSCYAAAMRADGAPEPTHDDYHGEFAERFGECVCYMMLGHGVSWFDDHAEFQLHTPYVGDSESCELQDLAHETCPECKRKEDRDQ